MSPRIKVSGVSHSYPDSTKATGTLALENIELEIPQHDFFVIVGPTGCGKSTLLAIIAGLVKPTQGEVFIDGQQVRGPNPKKVALMFQDPLLLPWLRIRDNVKFALKPQGIPSNQAAERADGYLKMVDLADFADSYPHQLSVGMRQRASLARALSLQSEILLMDEPFSALDEQTRLVLSDELIRIWQEIKLTIVFVTHSLVEAIYLAERVGVMSFRPGRLKLILDIPLSRPRDMGTPNFEEIYQRMKIELKDEAMRGVSRSH